MLWSGISFGFAGTAEQSAGQYSGEPFCNRHIDTGDSCTRIVIYDAFSATLIAKDRESALLQRLYTTPLTGFDFIMGYMLPILPIALGQTVICCLAAIPLGLTLRVNIIYAVIGIVPMAFFNIALGLLCSSVLDNKQVGEICGALLTNLSAWLSGVWFDLKLVGGVFEKIANVLPFFYTVEMEKALFSGNFVDTAEHILPIFSLYLQR